MCSLRFLGALVFMVSFVGILAELFFALILGVKSWSHMVYVAISFALLGYGVGSNLFLIFGNRFKSFSPRRCYGFLCFALGISLVTVSQLLPFIPLELTMITDGREMGFLALVCLMVMLPFVFVGYLLVMIFETYPQHASTLYFWDLLGAGLASILFYFLTRVLGPLRSLSLVSAFLMLFVWAFTERNSTSSAYLFFPIGLAVLFAWLSRNPEPDYYVDSAISWECIPKFAGKGGSEALLQKWSPMGRTDLYEISNTNFRMKIENENSVTFEINVTPPPDFHCFVNSFRASTPVYELSKEGLERHSSSVRLFSQDMEIPYCLLEKPRVLVIGVGGGRDVFMAKTHGAKEVVGAEINPVTFAAMSKGGIAYEYSGGIYNLPGVSIFNTDGRHLVKTQAPGHYDLLVLNGVDTFASLSTGAYSFVENYLYTREAMEDYLRVLRPGGILNLNRWFESPPRESLRLFVMILDALRCMGVEKPLNHVIVGYHRGWGLILAKKTPFNEKERASVLEYFRKHDTSVVYIKDENIERNWQKMAASLPASKKTSDGKINIFYSYAAALQEGREAKFLNNSFFDLSVVRDDSPFFYKSYKFNLALTSLKNFGDQHKVTSFVVQIAIVAVVSLFILVFMLTPLFFLKGRGMGRLPWGTRIPILLNFTGLGLGFIFVEISMMQKLTLLLGSPIYSISTTLAALLIFSALGSWLAGKWTAWMESQWCVLIGYLTLSFLLGMFSLFGASWIAWGVTQEFWIRMGIACMILAPMGVCLGLFFPLGLLTAAQYGPDVVPWAWGINFGFTVLGSVLVIMIAQFSTFTTALFCADMAYLLSVMAFWFLPGPPKIKWSRY